MPCEKMTKKQEKEFGEAITARLHEYEDIMAGEKEKLGMCNICDVFIVPDPDFMDGEDVLNCKPCPLSNRYGGCHSCLNYSATIPAHQHIENRYKWLLKRIKAAGYEYK